MSITGTTGSGKTTWLYRLLQNKDSMFSNPPTSILYCYGAWQPLFNDMESALDIDFHKGVPTEKYLSDFSNPEESKLVVLDDLMGEIANDQSIQDLFSKGSHHLNLTVIWLSQNLFYQGKVMRTINLNTHYIVLLKNPRVQQIQTLSTQMGLGKSLLESYHDCMKSAYGYLVVDLCPHSVDDYKIKTNIFPGEDTVVYMPL